MVWHTTRGILVCVTLYLMFGHGTDLYKARPGLLSAFKEKTLSLMSAMSMSFANKEIILQKKQGNTCRYQ